MKKLMIMVAGFALVASACGKKDKAAEKIESAADTVAEKVDGAADTMAKKAGEMKDSAESYGSGEKEPKEAYGSGEKSESYGSGSDPKMAMDVLSKSCTDDGVLSSEDCTCTSKVMVDNLKPETLAVFVMGTKTKIDGGEEAMAKFFAEKMTQEQQQEIFGVSPKLLECGPEVAKLFQR